MAFENPILLVAVASFACLLIATWVKSQYGWSAAVVVGGCSIVTLALVWTNYQVFSISDWASGSLWRSLVVFLPPLLIGTFVVVWQKPANRELEANPVQPEVAGQEVSSRSVASWLQTGSWLLALAIVPGLITLIPRIHISGVPFVGSVVNPGWPSDFKFTQIMWWAVSSILIYVLVPVLYSRVFRQRIRSYGLSLSFVKTEITLFLLVAPVIAALVWLATADIRFQHMYPFYSMQPNDPNGVTKLLIFEAMYGLSFVALEFFFRGFLVHAGNRVVGVHAVALMASSYCLIHLGKPMPECLSSLIGGLLLGFVSLRLKSIAVGVVAHLTMAWGTDAAVLWRSS